jgi:hypothetical protein
MQRLVHGIRSIGIGVVRAFVQGVEMGHAVLGEAVDDVVMLRCAGAD